MSITIGGVFICSTVLILYVSHLSEKALTAQILSNLNGLSSSKSNEIADSFKKLQRDIKNLSDSKFIQDALVSYESVAYGTGLDLEEDSNISGSTYFKTIENKYLETFHDYLSSLPLKSFALIMKNGFTVATVGEELLLGKNILKGSMKNNAINECLKSALTNGFHFTGIATENGKNKLYICQSISSKYDRDGYHKNAQMGILVASIDWNFLARIKDFHEGLGESGQLYISDNGKVITPPRHLRDSDLDSLISRSLKISTVENTGTESPIKTGFLNEEILFVSKKIEITQNVDWHLIGQISTEEALASVVNLKNWSYIVLVIGLVLISLVSWYIITKIINKFIIAGSEVSNCSSIVNTACSKFTDISATVTSSSQQQASSLHETSASVEEMNAMVGKTLEISKQTSEKSTICTEKALEGEVKMSTILESVNEVGNKTSESFEKVQKTSLNSLNEVLQAFANIESKTKMINEIAFQTKLLSFNASVEAARAGEHGKGFSVVAQEVGQLANSVNKSAKEIDQLLSTTRSRISEMLIETKQTMDNAIKESKDTVESTFLHAEKGLQFFKELSGLIKQINEESLAVSGAADEQSKGISEINKAILQISHSNENNVSMVFQLEEQTKNLVKSSQLLDDSSNEMNHIIYGSLKKVA